MSDDDLAPSDSDADCDYNIDDDYVESETDKEVMGNLVLSDI